MMYGTAYSLRNHNYPSIGIVCVGGREGKGSEGVAKGTYVCDDMLKLSENTEFLFIWMFVHVWVN